MDPERLILENVGQFPYLDFEIPPGVTALIGPNGSGKSTILNALERALFAEGSRDLGPMLGNHGDRLSITHLFEHAGSEYRVRRGYSGSGRGRATLDLEELVDGEWVARTKETAAATQAWLNDTLGLSRRLFRTSAFIGQMDSAAFPEASPAERKALIGEALDPHEVWPRLAERARTAAKAAEQAIAADQARIADREEIAEQLPSLKAALAEAEGDQQTATAELDVATYGLDKAQAALAANAAAAERHRAAQQALTAASQERARAASALTEAEGLAEKLPGLREKIAVAESEAGQVPSLETLVELQRQGLAEAERAKAERRSADLAEEQARREYLRLAAEHETLAAQQGEVASRYEHLQEAAPGAERCTLCSQLLGVEAREATLTALSAELSMFTPRLVQLAVWRDEANRAVETLIEAARAITIPVVDAKDYDTPLRQARQAAEGLSGLRVLLRATEDHANRVPALREAHDQAVANVTQRATESAATAEAVQDEAQLAQAAASARAAQQARRSALDAAQAQLIRLGEQVRQTEEASAEARRLREQTAEGQRRLDTLKFAERACGRDGIPALIAENTVPQLEAEANRILERLPTASGTTFRVELRTQRALKGDATALRETLDILVSDRQTTREFLTYSGGECFRVSFALRWALAKLLAGRRGAESRLLVIDEPDGLDTGGMDGLAALLAEEGETFSKVLLVSHNPLLASAFEQVVEVESDGEVSRLAGEALTVERAA